MKLMQEFKDEPAVGTAVVLRCAAALAILVGIAVIGITGETGDQSIAAASFHRWQLADRKARQQAAHAATHTQAAGAGVVNARKSSLEQPAGALPAPVRN